jgi:hypothetical protein
MWNPPSLQLKWGAYFREDVTEQASIVTMTVAAKTAGLITAQQGVEKLAPIYGTEDAEAVLDALEAEKAENQKNAIEHAKALGATKPPLGAKPNEGQPTS